MATAAQINEIIKLYVGYYNRAPDALGLNFWVKAFDGGFSLAEMAVDFSTQAETKANYPFFDPTQKPNPTLIDLGVFIDTVYQNLFNRTPDQPGKDFWSGKINSGEFTVGQAISLIIAGATTSPDADVVANKVAAGLDFYTKLNAEPGGSDYVFKPADVTAATDIQKNVTADSSSLTTAAAASDSYIADFSAGAGVAINLTPGTDQPGGGANAADTQGTSGDDTYSATVEANGGGTLQNSDNIAAGNGIDTLNIRVISTTSGGQIVSPAGSSLEKAVVTNQTSNGIFILDFAGIAGETEVTALDNQSSALTGFSNLDSGTDIRMENVDGIVGVNFKGDRSGSTNDNFDLFVRDSGTENQSAVFFIADAQLNSSDTSFEVANVEVGGSAASFLNLLGLELNVLNVTGSQQLNAEDTVDNFEDLRTVDASALTGGGINIDASGSTHSTFSFTGSAQDDSVELNNSLFNNANTMSLDGGNGTDTLIIETFNNLSTTSVNAASRFEALEARNSTSSLDANDYVNIHTFVFAGQTGNDSRINITGVTGGDKFVFESDVGQGDEAVRFAADTAGQSLTFELKAGSGTNDEIRIISDTNSNNGSAAVGFGNSNISSVEIISSGSNTNANVIRAVDNNNNNYFAFDNQNGPSNFSISGAQALTITAEAGVNLDASSDERGFQSGVNLDGSDATGALRIAGSGSADAIMGGAGNDIIYGLGGDDVLTGNDGSDQFRFSNHSGTDKIQDFVAGEDKIGLHRVDFGNTNASSEGTALSANDYVQNLQAVANLTNADSNKLVELQVAATENQITQTTVGATNTYLLVFNQTSGKGELWFDNDWSSTTSRSMTAEFDNITDVTDLIGLTNTDFVEFIF